MLGRAYLPAVLTFMKKTIHPAYNTQAAMKCACGAKYTIASTTSPIEVEICSNCHPFYTGAKKILDVAGRVEKFQAKLKKTQELNKAKRSKRKVQKAKPKRKAQS